MLPSLSPESLPGVKHSRQARQDPQSCNRADDSQAGSNAPLEAQVNPAAVRGAFVLVTVAPRLLREPAAVSREG